MMSAFTCHLWNFPWSVADARRSVQNILNPNRVQEYLKCLNDMGYHERTYTRRQSSKYSEKPPLQRWFFHIWRLDYFLPSKIAMPLSLFLSAPPILIIIPTIRLTKEKKANDSQRLSNDRQSTDKATDIDGHAIHPS